MRKLKTFLVIASVAFVASCGNVIQQLLMGDFDESLLKYRTSWHGGIVGSPPGFLPNTTFEDMSSKALEQAYESGKVVEYRSADGRIHYRARPTGDYYRQKNLSMDCRNVIEEVYENRKFIQSVERQVCTKEIKKRKIFLHF